MSDPIVEEVRKYRKEHTLKFHGKLSEICEDLRRIQESSGHDVVRLTPKKIGPSRSSGRRKRTAA